MNQPMRVLMTTDTVGGVWTYSLSLARAMQGRRVEFILAAMGGPANAAQSRSAAQLENLTLVEGDYKLEWMDDPWEDVAQAGEWLLELEARFRPDLVHLNNYAHGSLPWTAPILMVGHSCVLSWWQAVKGEPAPPEWDRYRQVVRDGLHAAQWVLAPTGALLSALEEHYGDLPQTGVIYNGRDPQRFLPEEKQPIVFAAGRLWDPAKNIAALAEASRDLSWPVFIAGANQHPDGGKSHYQNVSHLGHLSSDAIRDWFARAAIYALPARYEPFGLSPLEAGLAGCALVLGDIPSLREVWGNAAIFVDPDEPERLTQAIQDLIQDRLLRRRMALQARRRALRYTADRMAARYLALYRKLLEGEAAGIRIDQEVESISLCVS